MYIALSDGGSLEQPEDPDHFSTMSITSTSATSSPASSVQSRGDSPREVSTNVEREIKQAGSPKQESHCQKRQCKTTRQYRHMPYGSPTGSTCSSDESTAEDVGDSGRPDTRRRKRSAANDRERKRMHTVNAAFDQLRELVPAYPSNRKLSKIDTLRLACSYIEDLTSLLSSPAMVHGEDVKLYHSQCHEFEGFLQQSPTGYQGVHVKSEFGDYCNLQHYRVQPSYISDCASSDYSASESENHSPPYYMQNCPPGIGVRPPAFSRTSSDSVAVQIAQTSIGHRPVLSPLATVQHTSPHLVTTGPQNHVSPPVWQRTGSVPYCLYGQ